MKLSDIKAGDMVKTDKGFTCLDEGLHRVEQTAAGDLFLKCSDGEHLLDGQQDGPGGDLVGISPV